MDLDNLDNVTRIAYHMGIKVHSNLPLEIASGMVGLAPDGNPIFKSSCKTAISEWLRIREAVYNSLMLAPMDFAGKLMLLYATVRSLKIGLLSQKDWKLTDGEFLAKLHSSDDHEISSVTKNWLLGDLWELGPLLWASGAIPSFADMGRFSDVLSTALGQTCFAYRIKDKRKRRLQLHLDSGKRIELGEEGQSWLIGFGSPRGLSSSAQTESVRIIRDFFNTDCWPIAGGDGLFDMTGV
jgi:hypothetical protein